MAAEVKKRLDAIDMVDRSITMKIMKRDPTAPVEPPKVSFPRYFRWATLHCCITVSWAWIMRLVQ